MVFPKNTSWWQTIQLMVKRNENLQSSFRAQKKPRHHVTPLVYQAEQISIQFFFFAFLMKQASISGLGEKERRQLPCVYTLRCVDSGLEELYASTTDHWMCRIWINIFGCWIRMVVPEGWLGHSSSKRVFWVLRPVNYWGSWLLMVEYYSIVRCLAHLVEEVLWI